MSKLGQLLRETREKQDLSLKDVAAKTRIREYVLEVLEDGRFLELPSYVHVHGFVKQYSEALGLDFAEVKKMLDLECKKSEFGAVPQNVVENGDSKNDPYDDEARNYTTVIIALGAVFLIVILLVIRTITGTPPEPKEVAATDTHIEETVPTEPEPVVVADNVTASADNVTVAPDNATTAAPDNATAAAPASGESNPTAVTPDADNESAPLPVIQEPVNETRTASLTFTDICWVHINIDGEEDIDFIAQAGETRQVEFVDYFVIDIGNAAAVAITDGDRTYAYFGDYAQPVKNLRFSYNDRDKFTFERM